MGNSEIGETSVNRNLYPDYLNFLNNQYSPLKRQVLISGFVQYSQISICSGRPAAAVA